MAEAEAAKEGEGPLLVGRYALYDALASGGMATVHLGRLLGPEGFGRTVAIKRLHAHFTTDPEFVTMFTDEARIVARIRHPNVVAMVDVLESPDGLFLVMEYIHGESLSRLLKLARAAGQPAAVPIVAAILHGVLLGLHGAHETRDANDALLEVVHRDVSPQNVIVGVDGVARVLDFGVAKATGRAQVTREGQIKGKLAYMAPEQIRGRTDRRADVFAAGVVLWEALTGRRLHEGSRDVDIVTRVMKGEFPRPSEHRPDLPPVLDAIVLRALAADPARRYATARDMALDLERAVPLAPPSELGPWVSRHAADVLATRERLVAAMERSAALLVAGDRRPAGPGPGPARASSPEMADATGGSAATLGAVVGAEPPEVRRDLTVLVAAVGVCFALALVGLGLGGWALRARALAPARAAVPASASTTSPPAPRVPPPVVRTEASAPPVPEASAPPRATTSTSPTGAAPKGTASAGRPLPRECDPPFTTDEQGHKHYKLSCLDK